MNNFYDGTKLLSLKDLNGNTPEIYICTSNRSAGKTTYFSRLCVNKFLKGQGKFMLLYRFDYELAGVADKFFKDIQGLFFPNYEMKSQSVAKGVFHELYLKDIRYDVEESEGTPCGYAVALNKADAIKKYSHLFSDTQRMLFDEFQSETNRYCANEVQKFISIHTSVARGQGKHNRYVPVYMISNPVSIINPYYTELGISTRLTDKTNFLRGNGYVLEQGYNEVARAAQNTSIFNMAFAQNEYMAYSQEGVYLNDNVTFIEKPMGEGRYLATLIYMGKEFGLRAFDRDGIIYCDNSVDKTYPHKLAITTDDMRVNYLMLKRSDDFVKQIRFYFEHGCLRFKDLQCKECVLRMISY